MLFRLRAYDEVSSTNAIVKRAIEEGEPEGLAIGARTQTAGYGRQGRTWSSPDGGAYLSLLLRPRRPPAQLPTLSLVAGVAVRRAIVSLACDEAADRVKLKWPNDVVLAGDSREAGVVCDAGRPRAARDVDGPSPACASHGRSGVERAPFRKLSGISLESHAGGICVGIGVNVLRPTRVEAVAGKYAPAYMDSIAGAVAVEEVRDAVLRQFATCYERWLECGFAAFEDEYRAHAVLVGRAATIENVDGTTVVRGEVEGVDASGCLIVRPAGAREVVRLSSGEVHLSRIGD